MEKKKRMNKDEQRLRELWDTIKPINMYKMGVPEKKKETEKNIQKIIPENILNMTKNIN